MTSGRETCKLRVGEINHNAYNAYVFEQPCVAKLPRNGSPRTTRHTRIFKRRQQRPANKSSRSSSKSEKLIPTEPTRWHRTPCLTVAGTSKAYQSLRGKYEHYVYSVSLTISWPPPYSCVIGRCLRMSIYYIGKEMCLEGK